jgi:hypothetical protein
MKGYGRRGKTHLSHFPKHHSGGVSCVKGEVMKNAFESSGSSPTPSKSVLVPTPDILVENHGSIFLLRPITSVGQDWLKENVVGGETQVFGNAVVCEPRFVMNIVNGARAEGLVVR